MDFKRIELSDQSWIEELLQYSDYNSSEYCFSSMYNWKDIYHTEIARMGDYGILRSGFKEFSYLYPFGRGDIRPVVEAIREDAKAHQVDLVFSCVLEAAKAELEAVFPGQFQFYEDRNYFDYIYLSETLANLKGKKLHGKRNHINNFKNNNPDWTFEPITKNNLAECWQMNEKWCEINGCTLESDLAKEHCAVQNAFDHFEEEKLRGGLLRTNGEIVAYTMGRPLNSDTFIVHIEKAYATVQGSYPMINQQFVANCCMDFKYINREDDTGAEGLRKAKLSYYPELLVTKYYVKLTEEC